MKAVTHSLVVAEALRSLGEAKQTVERMRPFFDEYFSPARHEALSLATHLLGWKTR